MLFINYQSRYNSSDSGGQQDIRVALRDGIEGFTGSSGQLSILGQQCLSSCVGTRLQSSHTLHDSTLLLEGILDLSETVGDGHSSLQLGDDLHVVAHVDAQ